MISQRFHHWPQKPYWPPLISSMAANIKEEQQQPSSSKRKRKREDQNHKLLVNRKVEVTFLKPNPFDFFRYISTLSIYAVWFFTIWFVCFLDFALFLQFLCSLHGGFAIRVTDLTMFCWSMVCFILSESTHVFSWSDFPYIVLIFVLFPLSIIIEVHIGCMMVLVIFGEDDELRFI